MSIGQDFSSLIGEDAIGRYLTRRKGDLLSCYNALKEDDYTRLREISHKILGSCQSFGFADLRDIASSINQAASAHNSEESQRAIREFDGWIRAHS